MAQILKPELQLSYEVQTGQSYVCLNPELLYLQLMIWYKKNHLSDNNITLIKWIYEFKIRNFERKLCENVVVIPTLHAEKK